jgi:3-oxoadipate enol-lactonase
MIIDTSFGKIYVERHGDENKPVLVLLNGIMMSTLSWTMFIPKLTPFVHLVLIDFLDQGQSVKLTKHCKVADQSKMLFEVVNALNLKRFHLCGISYGGEVALDFSIQHQNYVTSLMVFNTTMKTSLWLKDIGDSWIHSAKDPHAFYLTTLPTIYSHHFYETHQAWMEKRKETLLQVFSNQEFLDAMVRLTRSSEDFDVSEACHTICVPTLVVSSELDTITPAYEQEKIAKAIKSSTYILVKECGHATMYEKPNLFVSLILGHVLHDHQCSL